ncbi:MAG: anti-sigma factor family protein [Roseiarcus sp.]
MKRPVETAEVFAYVDNCLDPDERRAFEARLRENAELKRQVAKWESQNQAIRAAYGATASARPAIDLGRNSNENVPAWMVAAMQSRRNAAAPRANAEARSKPSRSAAAPDAQTRSAAPPARRFLAGPRVAALAAILLVVSAPSGPKRPQGELIDAGLSAYRAFATGADVPVEFRAGDPDALTKWLAPQFPRGIVVPRISSDELTLLGARIAPGTTTSAAFLVYENRRGERVGLLIEPLDAPAPSRPTLRESGGISVAAWTDAGEGFAAAGSDPEEVAALTRLIERTPAPR